MRLGCVGHLFGVALCFFLSSASSFGALHFRVATYNVENYLDKATQSRSAKSPESKAKIQENILALKPDVIAVQEMGSLEALQGLRSALQSQGLDFEHWTLVTGSDTNVHVAILSKFPFSAERPRTNDSFLLGGRRFHVSRGFAEVDIQITPRYSFTMIAAHLKSKRQVAQADEAELRLEEAKILREEIDSRFAINPYLNLVVLGDFNDSKDSNSTKMVIGRGRHRLIDTRPAEQNGDAAGSGGREITWTHFFPKEDSYSRIDYILLSPGMAREWIKEGTQVLAVPGWGIASDHRPLVAEFEAEDR